MKNRSNNQLDRMKFSWITLLALLIFVIGLFQCDKDDSSLNTCTPIDQFTTVQGQPLYFNEFPIYSAPYFNPKNSDEIIVRYSSGTSIIPELVKYNIRTGEKTSIYAGPFDRRARWGKKGWILLGVFDENTGRNIAKIREDGSDYTELTSTGNCFFPEWNHTSEQLVYEFAFSSPTKYIIISEDGSFVDTIPCGATTPSSWQHPEFSASGRANGLTVRDPYTCDIVYSYTEVEEVEESNGGAAWLDEHRVIWCHTHGIFLSDIEAGTTRLIRETCNSDTYQYPTYAPDIDKVVMERVQYFKEENKTYGTAVTSIVMMNLNGSGQETIEIF